MDDAANRPPKTPDAPDAAPAPPAAPRPAESDGLISIDRFMEVELRVGLIAEARAHPNADRLLVLQVDVGDERRQIVAGIAGTYEPEALVGRRIVVVANLKPARLRGEESQGMLLAADLDGRAILAGFDEPVPPGTRVR